ncbi:purine-cytosine permease family protein [Arsenophonus nasoniae]|uniref:Cytosine permease n=1 Tax=Arsenophonus nasoniae TaxID=638 RepID=A0AA95GTI5_9GAMM|nr:cytosine permease [Arsenophonus nasoniae]WGM03731.1 cytosine permease [Arsenophonus nasoniae]
MKNKNSVFNHDHYTLSRVPLSERKGLFTTCIIRIGATTSLVQFMLGATLGHSMTFNQAMIATILGSLFLEFISLGLGIAGAKEGLSTSLLSRWCGFGYFGSALIGGMISISTLGWFGVQNAIVAKGILAAMALETPHYAFYVVAAISGLSLSTLVAFGFNGLSWIAKTALPIFFLVVGWSFYQILKNYDIYHLFTMQPLGDPLSISEAATAVAGGYIVFAIISPDMSRYCKDGRQVFWMMTSSIFVGEFIVNGISILISHALNTANVVEIMTQSAGWIGLFSVLLSAVKINDLNLYSSVLGFSNFLSVITRKKWHYAGLTLFLGITGTCISMTGILEKFIPFLIMLGVLFPPVAGIMLVDYYILRTHRDLLELTHNRGTLPSIESIKKTGKAGMMAWIGGSVVGFTIESGIPSLNSLLAASVIYGVICIFNTKIQILK